MKLNKTLLIAALSLFAASGLMAKPKAKEEIPGIAPQPAIFFYTGKPFDPDLGEYTFAFRNYNPQMARWTSADPSGFPDGVNNNIFCYNTPLMGLDPNGLEFLFFDGTSLSSWTGSGFQGTGQPVDWGTRTNDWAAVSGGAAGYAGIPKGWWSLTGFKSMLDQAQPGFYPEKDVKVGNILFAGTMSSWDRTSGPGYGGYDAPWSTARFGYNTKEGIAPNSVQYKIGLQGIHGNTHTYNEGYRIHPTMANETHGCIGLTEYSGSVAFKAFISSKMNLELFVE